MVDERFLYKVCREVEWREAIGAGTYAGSALDVRDGFIHLSTPAQVAETLRLHFAGQADLVLVAFDPKDLEAHTRWEPSRGGALFPHVYGALSPALARQVTAVEVDAEGRSALR